MLKVKKKKEKEKKNLCEKNMWNCASSQSDKRSNSF